MAEMMRRVLLWLMASGGILMMAVKGCCGNDTSSWLESDVGSGSGITESLRMLYIPTTVPTSTPLPMTSPMSTASSEHTMSSFSVFTPTTSSTLFVAPSPTSTINATEIPSITKPYKSSTLTDAIPTPSTPLSTTSRVPTSLSSPIISPNFQPSSLQSHAITATITDGSSAVVAIATSETPASPPTEDRDILIFWLVIGLAVVAVVLTLFLCIMISIFLWHRSHMRRSYDLKKASNLTYGRSYMEDPLPDLSSSEDESPWKIQARLKQRFNNVLDSLNRNVNVMDNLNSIGKAIEPGIGSEEEDDETYGEECGSGGSGSGCGLALTTTIELTASPMPTPSRMEEEKEEGDDAGLSAGAVAGIAVGSVVGVAAVGGVGALVAVLIVKAVKGGGSKVSPLKKGDAGGERVKVEKQSLIETLPKPE
ncbi:hypothetical protein GBAR_LOCUS18617 [Geodia barretti]|uniref:Uncharacterized protein n=1 Tax=Geodia barretti TaxID=519541 RepID=A0AA35SQQ4_GEOBA|nr:hypothetical protein GBAR_LOCUS18617 [Geodia barretti]